MKNYVDIVDTKKRELVCVLLKLKFCFKECPKNEKRNRARILQYLIPVQIYFGIYPSNKLIEKYDLNQYIELVPAIVCGDIQTFEKNMKLNQSFFLNRGIYLLIEKYFPLRPHLQSSTPIIFPISSVKML